MERDPDAGGYTGAVVELPEIVAGGETEEETLQLVREAILFTLEVISQLPRDLVARRAAPWRLCVAVPATRVLQ